VKPEFSFPHIETWVDAAVIVPIYRKESDDHLILTKRTEEVLHHKGQICFPGGAKDPEDKSLWETALRECQEEIGLNPSQVRFVREMGRHHTPTGFRVTPFVAAIEPPVVFTPNPNEIAAILEIPFIHFRDRNNVRLVTRDWEGRTYLDPRIVYEGHEIWGMTGRILCEFFEIPLS
jgi:8-oxo-dGTP pyrophosphatase MutT (NUDIX family)